MEQGSAQAPTIWPSMGKVPGVNVAGLPVDEAQYEYEVCFQCHADDNALDEPYISRVITQLNTRFQFESTAVSFHPVTAPGRNNNVPSLKPPYDESSMIYCSDCHGSEAGGGGPRGVHGSNIEPLLVRQYETLDYTPESAQAYALCYHCHYREGPDGILSDRSFPHELHVVDERTPCSVCHDSHGVSSLQGTMTNNAHLINFDASVVFPDPVTGRLEYRTTGQFQGECFLSCHGANHSPASYAQ
jgi:cytochrome c553